MEDKPKVSSLATLPALAKEIDRFFPEIEGRVFPVSEAEVTKENIPTMPLCMLALNLNPFNMAANSNKEIDYTEDFVVEFWFETNKYKRANNTISPFWAYYDFDPLRDKMITLMKYWKSPRDFKCAIKSMEIDSSELAVMVVFRIVHEVCWCENPALTEQYTGQPADGYLIGRDVKVVDKVEIKIPVCCEPTCEEPPQCP